MDSHSQITNNTTIQNTSKTEDSTIQTGTSIGQSNSTLISTATEFESTNLSNVSITDATTGLSSINLSDSDSEKSRNVTRELIVKKQLLHDVQRLKIELSQKELLIDTLKAEHLNQMDDMEEKLADAIHSRQLIQAKTETEMRMIKSEAEKQISNLKKDLNECSRLQKHYQRKYENETNKKLHDDLKSDFVPKNLNEDEYLDLKSRHENDLAIQDVFNIKLYEGTRPLKVEIDTLHQRLEILTGELHDKTEELEQEKQDQEEERKVRAELDVRCQRYQVQIEELRNQANQKSYKNQNFDLVQSERDALERQIVDLERACTVYKTELEAKTDQMETHRNDMIEQNQTVALLKQDKEYLSRQLNEINPRFKMVEEKLYDTSKQLDDVKRAREELYEKYLNSREHYKREYEERMRREIDEISSKTNTELDRIKANTRELYERENRSLNDAKNMAVLEQERLSNNERETQAKYNELLGEFRQLQISSDSKIADVQNECKLKSYELDRVQLLYEESLKNSKQTSHHVDSLSQKIEALSKEYYGLKNSSEKQITELTGRNEELKNKLTIYEKLEQELDDVVMQAAELTNEDDSERVLFAYGYGANVPSTAKRRMQQSVQLARRVLHLERANTSLRHEIERENKKCKQLADELENTNNLLHEAQQPYNYLVESIKSRDDQNKALKNTITTLEEDLRSTRKENVSLKTSNDQVSADLERLLNQREEMNVLKQVVVGLKSSASQSFHDSLHKTTRTSSIVYGPQVNKRTSLREDIEQEPIVEKPIIFKNNEPPSWYTKLKQKNEASIRRPKPVRK